MVAKDSVITFGCNMNATTAEPEDRRVVTLTTPRRHTPVDDADDDPAQDLAALRRATLHNMRLLKSQIVPLIGAALRTGGATEIGVAQRDRWMKTALGMIDDTLIAAAVPPERVAEIDLAELIRTEAAENLPGAGVLVAELPRLWARVSHFQLLVREALKIAERSISARTAGICVQSVGYHDGRMILWLTAGKEQKTPRDVDEPGSALPHDWSLCDRLIQQVGGKLIAPCNGRGGFTVGLLFPAGMVVETRDEPSASDSMAEIEG